MDEQFVLDEVEALGAARFWLETERTAIAIGVRRVKHARHERTEAAALHGLACGQRQRAHRAAVKAAEKGDEVLPSGGIPRQLEACFDRFGAGVAEKRFRAASD